MLQDLGAHLEREEQLVFLKQAATGVSETNLKVLAIR